MTKPLTNVFAENHRRQQRMTLAVAAVLVVAAAIPRNERAMFVLTPIEGPKVFAAIVPPIGYLPVNPFGGEPSLRRLGGDPFVRQSVPPPPAGPIDTPGGASPGDFGPVSGGTPLFADVPRFIPAAAFGDPGGPVFGGSSPAAPGPTGGTTDPLAPTSPVVPVAPVPEPASWAMMIAGFSIVGVLLRRRRRSVAGIEGQHTVAY